MKKRKEQRRSQYNYCQSEKISPFICFTGIEGQEKKMAVKNRQTCQDESNGGSKPFRITLTTQLEGYQQAEQRPENDVHYPEYIFNALHRTKIAFPTIR